jgi:hypothetical protein
MPLAELVQCLVALNRKSSAAKPSTWPSAETTLPPLKGQQ